TRWPRDWSSDVCSSDLSVPNAVHDERFVRRISSGLAMKVKPNQQVGTKTNAFPTYKHQRVVVPQDQRQHGEHEQVQISEETVVRSEERRVGKESRRERR